MKKGIESLKQAVLKDTSEGENCFNENGCDHEFTRMVPATGLVAQYFDEVCISVCKCFHRYCNVYSYALKTAKEYSLVTNKTVEYIISVWESDRTYWYVNYYQEYKISLQSSTHKERSKKYLEAISECSILQDEIQELKTALKLVSKNKCASEAIKSDIGKKQIILEEKSNYQKLLELSYLIIQNRQ